jgi:hypothetical protein
MSLKLIIDVGMDSEAAGLALAKWAGDIGFRVKAMSSPERFGLRSRYNYTVTMAGTAEMRRIILIAAFNGSPNHRDPDGKVRFANRVNMDYNVCKLAFDQDGALYLEFVLYVEGELTPTLWSTFIAKADEGIAWLHSKHKAEFDDLIA